MNEIISTARAAVARGDWLVASQSWHAVLEAGPDLEEAYFGAGLALRRLGRLGEAERVLAPGLVVFPSAERLVIENAWVAFDRRDWPEALCRFGRIRERFPENPSGYVGLGATLREMSRLDEADAVLAAGIARFPKRVDLLINYAWSGHRRRDWPEALRRWETVRRSHPDDPSSYSGMAATARAAGQKDFEDDILCAAQRRFPSSVQFAMDYAASAASRADGPEAIRRWEDVRLRFPAHEGGYVGLTRALLFAERADEAEILLSQAIEAYPQNLDLVTEYARVAAGRNDWPQALARWEAVRSGFPASPAGYLGIGLTLRLTQRLDEAETQLAAARERFPDSFELAFEHVWVARSRRDWAEALRRLTALQTRFSGHAAIYAATGAVPREQGSLDEAEATLSEAMVKFPDDTSVAIEHALVANARRDWGQAALRWQPLLSMFPGNRRVAEGFGQARWGSQIDVEVPASEELQEGNPETSCLTPGDAQSGFISYAKTGVPDRFDPATLLTRFESLGENCEFGLVQRHFGAEPLGLLRWTGTAPSSVIKALNNRFEGVGELENTTLQPIRGEYVTEDRRYGMAMHTFIAEGQGDRDKLSVQQCRRLRYLKNKLVDDLNSGEKILVCRSVKDLTDATIGALFKAVRAYGNNALLCVRLHDHDNPPGTVRSLEPGLFVASIDRLGPQQGPTGDTWDISFSGWLSICREVELLRHMA